MVNDVLESATICGEWIVCCSSWISLLPTITSWSMEHVLFVAADCVSMEGTVTPRFPELKIFFKQIRFNHITEYHISHNSLKWINNNLFFIKTSQTLQWNHKKSWHAGLIKTSQKVHLKIVFWNHKWHARNRKAFNKFPHPVTYRAPKTQPRKILTRLHLILITCKLPIRRATFSSRRGEIHKTIILNI